MYDFGIWWVPLILLASILGVFVVALLVKLWNTLDYIRLSCQFYNMESESMKKQAVQMCKNGDNIFVIANKLKINPTHVKRLCLETLKQKAVLYTSKGKSISMVSQALCVSNKEVESWLKESHDNALANLDI